MPIPPPPNTSTNSDNKPPILKWVFIIAATAGIIWMLMNSPKEKPLVCDKSAQAGLTQWGSCTTQ